MDAKRQMQSLQGHGIPANGTTLVCVNRRTSLPLFVCGMVAPFLRLWLVSKLWLVSTTRSLSFRFYDACQCGETLDKRQNSFTSLKFRLYHNVLEK